MSELVKKNTNDSTNKPTIKKAPLRVFMTIYKTQWSILASIYSSRTFTKYAVYSLLSYKAFKHPYLGVISFNCNTSAMILFNYVRFFFPDLFQQYKDTVERKYEITKYKFIMGDIIAHIIPFTLSMYWLPQWYYKIRKTPLFYVSTCSFLFQLGWAYYYSSGLDVSRVYDMENSDVKLTGHQCKRVWIIISICHYAVYLLRISKKYIPNKIILSRLITR